MSALASFASPSPSRMTRIRLGSCILRAMDNGATASGGETIAPNTKPTGQEKPNSQCVAAAAAIVVNRTQPTASSEIGRRLNRNSRQLIATAEEYTTGGSTKSNTNSGASRTVGSPGTSARTTPVSTSRIAGGTFSRAATTATAAITINSKTRIWIVVVIIASTGIGGGRGTSRV